jgi:hemoglobin/transferrin/lactoferrin receptor protein
MKKLAIILSFSMLYHLATSQTLRVLDNLNLHPIVGATVRDSANNLNTITNTKGEADITQFSNSSAITISHAGYKTQTVSYGILGANKFEILVPSKLIDLDEVVIAAQRFDERRQYVPQQVAVIDAKELEWKSQQTSADVLIESGEVFVQKSQAGGGSPVMRGFEANKVLIVVDGVRMNNAIYRGGHLQNIITVDNAMLDRIELVFGPGSVIYGSDALGGVISFSTIKPSLGDSLHPFNFKANAYGRFASANVEKTGHIDLNFGSKKIGSLTSFTFSDFDDLRQGDNRNPFYGDFGKRTYYADRINGQDTIILNDNANKQVGSGYSQFDLMQKLLFRQSDKVSHTLNFQYSRSSNINRYDRLTEVRNGALRFGEWYYGPQKRLLAAYTLELNAAKGIYTNARLIAAFQDIEESRINRSFGKDAKTHQVEKVKVFTLNLDLNKLLGEKHELKYGLEGTYNIVNSTAFTEDIVTNEEEPAATRYPAGGSNMSSVAAYLTHTFKINRWLVLNEGIRFSNVNLNAEFSDTTFFPLPFTKASQHHNALSGSLGLIFNLPEQWRIVLAGSTGFRAPNVDDLAKVFESVPGSVVVPNPDLSPEYTYTGELTLGKSVGERLQVEATGYFTYIDNVIVSQPGTFNGADSIEYQGDVSAVRTNVNAGQGYITGFSAGFKADLNDNFSLSSKVSYTYGRVITDTLDQPLDHIPPFYGRTGVTYQRNKFQGEFYVLYNGWKYIKDYSSSGEDNPQYATAQGMPAWYTLNLRLGYQFNKYVRLQASCENLLDRNYRYFASGISAPGRNFMVTLKLSI